MRKFILFLALVSFIPSILFAQKKSTDTKSHVKSRIVHRSPLRVGVKAGSNISFLNDNDPLLNNSSKRLAFGAYGGGLLEVSGPAGSKLKGQVEVLYNYLRFSNNYSFNFSESKTVTELHQVAVPVLAKYFIVPRFSINAGAAVNFNLDATNTTTVSMPPLPDLTTSANLKDIDYLEPIQVSALVGATYYIHKGFFVDARYNYYFGSLTKQKTPADYAQYISAIQIGLGYKF